VNLMKLGFMLITLGFVVMLVALLLPFINIIFSGKVESIDIGGGGCIVILFIPICFGFGAPSLAQLLIIVAALLTLAILIVGLLMTREAKKGAEKLGLVD